MLSRTCITFMTWLIASVAVAQPARVSAPAPIGEWLVAKQVARIKIIDPILLCDLDLHWGCQFFSAWHKPKQTNGTGRFIIHKTVILIPPTSA